MEERPLGTFGKLLLFVLTVLAILILFSIFYYLEDWRVDHVQQTPDPEDVLTSGMLACMELGCPFGTNYIGSSSGEVYHDCTTSQARSINEENRVCFSSTSDAVDQGYRR
jgi:hypothetical protein